MGRYFSDIHASCESQFRGLPHGLADTPEIAASPTEETITPSHIPTRMVSACSMIRGMIRRISLWLEKSLCSVNDLTSLLYLQRVYHGKMRFSI